jgi:hypothetical protein
MAYCHSILENTSNIRGYHICKSPHSYKVGKIITKHVIVTLIETPFSSLDLANKGIVT